MQGNRREAVSELFRLTGGLCSKKRPSLDFCKDRCQIGPVYRTLKTSGSVSIAPHILNLGTRWRWVSDFTPRLLNFRRKAPGTDWIGCVSPRAGLDAVNKGKISCQCQETKLGTQSLYSPSATFHSLDLCCGFPFSRTRRWKWILTVSSRVNIARWTVWKDSVVAHFDALSQNLLWELEWGLRRASVWSIYGWGFKPTTFKLCSSSAVRFQCVTNLCEGGRGPLQSAGEAILGRDGLRHNSHVFVYSKTISAHCCLIHCCTFVSHIV